MNVCLYSWIWLLEAGKEPIEAVVQPEAVCQLAGTSPILYSHVLRGATAHCALMMRSAGRPREESKRMRAIVSCSSPSSTAFT